MKTPQCQIDRTRRWRQRNPEKMREIRADQYYRDREFILWKGRLDRLLMTIVRAHGDPEGY